METEVGKVTHYFTHLMVAVVKLDDKLKRGDKIHIVGHTSNFTQNIDTMQIEHDSIIEAGPGQEVGIRVVDHAHENDSVYKVA